MTSGATDPIDKFLDHLADSVEGLKGNDRAAYDDLEFFSRHVIQWNNPEFTPNSAFLQRLYEVLQHSPHDDILALGPRQSAKSYAVTTTYVAWQIGRNPLARFLLAFASTENQGLAFARQLDQIFTKNERYIRIFGELKPTKPEKWTEREMIVQRPTPPGGLKDPTISIVGLNSNVPSRRSDEIIIDDIVTAENAYSPIKRASVERFILQTCFPTCVPTGRKVIVGSRWDPRDFYHTIAERWGLEFPKTESINLSKLMQDVDAKAKQLEEATNG